MESAIIPLHTRVRGRARFRIRVSAGSPDFRRRVRTGILRIPDVKQVQINPVTDSLLVYFDPDTHWRAIADGISGVIEQTAGDDSGNENTGGPHPGEAAATPVPAVGQPFPDRWHQLQTDRVVERLDSSIEKGLDPESAGRRLRVHGENIIHEAKLRSRVDTLKDQFKFLPMALLLAESAAALFGGAIIEAVLLSTITAVNVMVGYFIDRGAEEAIAAFKYRPRPSAMVLREGFWTEVPGEKLVIGDILKLIPGTYVGADCRILEASHLKIDESILTGESNPVDKHVGAIADPAAAVFDQHNMALMGTLVVGGEGVAVVVATGSLTEYGKLNTLFNETIPPQTPVVGKIHDLSGRLLATALATGFGVGLISLLRGRRLIRAVGRAASIAATAVPTGLPSAATVNMAFGFQRLSREKVSIRRLHSLESLSAVQMICFDKTGTLTRSRIDVQRIHCAGKDIRVYRRAFRAGPKPFSPLEDPDFTLLLRACVLCSESRVRIDAETGRRQLTGSPTEAALLHLAIMAAFDVDGSYRRYPLKKVQHRSGLWRYMMTVHEAPGGRSVVFIKGNPSDLLSMCARERRGGKRVKLSEAARNRIEIRNQQMAGKALRILGFAYGTFKSLPDDPLALDELTWIGLVGMAEPIRQGVASLIGQLHDAGIRTVMITGDQSTTAEAVGRKIRLAGQSEIRIFDSSRFDTLKPELAAALIRDVQVFARTNPAQKLQIVQAYQRRGMVVAMTGDGINDGPALRAADIGIAMGLSGTDAARQIADMVLEQDNITSVNTAVMEGRTGYRNLKRALRYFIAANFSDMLMTAVASTISPGAALLDFRPVQTGLLTDLAPGLALLMEPARPDVGHEPPRNREEPLFSNHDMLSLFNESAVLAGGALTAAVFGLMRYGPGPRVATLAYESLALSKVLHALTCRPLVPNASRGGQRRTNPWLNAALAATLITQAGTLLIPGLRRFLKLAPPAPVDLAVVALTAWTTRIINRKIREDRQTGKRGGPEGSLLSTAEALRRKGG